MLSFNNVGSQGLGRYVDVFIADECVTLGRAYLSGTGVHQGPFTAVSWFERAAALKWVDGHVWLCLVFTRGLGGIQRDRRRALHEARLAFVESFRKPRSWRRTFALGWAYSKYRLGVWLTPPDSGLVDCQQVQETRATSDVASQAANVRSHGVVASAPTRRNRWPYWAAAVGLNLLPVLPALVFARGSALYTALGSSIGTAGVSAFIALIVTALSRRRNFPRAWFWATLFWFVVMQAGRGGS